MFRINQSELLARFQSVSQFLNCWDAFSFPVEKCLHVKVLQTLKQRMPGNNDFSPLLVTFVGLKEQKPG